MRYEKSLAFGRVLLFWTATMAVLALATPIGGRSGTPSVLIGSVTVPLTFALTLLFIKWEGKKPSEFGLVLRRATWLRFGAGILLGLSLIGIQTAIMMIAGGVRWIEGSFATPTLLPILGYLLLATREELAFRGYPLRLLDSKFGPWIAQIIVASMFIIEHKLGGASWENALLGAGLGSLVFGMAALATRGLALPIGIHAAWNIGDWARGGKGDGGLWSIVVEPGSGAYADKVAIGSYVVVMLCALAALSCAAFRVHRRTKGFTPSFRAASVEE